MIRKFLLVAGLALFEPGSTVQLMLAQLVCLAYLAAVLNLAPYKKESVDFTNQARLVDGVNVCANHCAEVDERKSAYSHDLIAKRVFASVARSCCLQTTNGQIMVSLLMAMALKTNLPQPGTFESIFFGVCRAPCARHP